MRMITKEQILEATANLLGKTSLPNGELSDWERFAQDSLDYCWRYHTWQWTLKRNQLVDIDSAGKAYLPEDADYFGYLQVDGSVLQSILDTGTNPYLEFDSGVSRYELVNGTIGGDIVYATEPPELTEDVKIPFPSAVTVAIGATVLAKQGENPNKADISQEWDSFHVALDKHVAVHEKNMPRLPGRSVNRQTRQSVNGTFTGQVR